MERDYINCSDMPQGLSMALSHNLRAMESFAAMPPESKSKVISGCRGISSKEEMQKYVDSITSGTK